jgi:hypothetical protein
MRDQRLLAWQWAIYERGHHDRGNLIVHAFTAPLFIAGCLAVVATPLWGWSGVWGAAAMLIALVLQGRGHRNEVTPPAPFEGPLDFVARFFAEQWVTFPRFVLSGAFARAYQASWTAPTPGPDDRH